MHAGKECSATQIRSNDVSIPHFQSLPNEGTYLLSTEMHQYCAFFFLFLSREPHGWACRNSWTSAPAGKTLRCTAKPWHVTLWKAKGEIMFCFDLFDGTILFMLWTKAGFTRRSARLPPFPYLHPDGNLGWLEEENVQISGTGMTLTALDFCYRAIVILEK